MLEVLARLDEALKECHASLIWALPGTTLVDGLDEIVRQQSQLEALRLRFVHEIDAQGIPRTHGASNTGVWLRNRYRTWPDGRSVKLATWLHDEGTTTATALAAGDINPAQARVIAKAVGNLPAERRTEAQHFMIGHAAALDPDGLVKIGERLLEKLDPERAEEHERQRLERAERRAEQDRAFTLTDHGDGRYRLTGWLPAPAAAAVNAALDPLCKPNPLDPSTATQRRADALADICRFTLNYGKLPDNGGDRPQVVVTLNYDLLRQPPAAPTLDAGPSLSAPEARLAACDAGIIPAVLGGKGQVLDMGRERRTFTGALRRALVLRDGGCTFPSCDRPDRWTDGHHIVHWGDGGETSLINTALLCGHHHRVIHRGEWEIRINPADGLPEFLPPAYIDRERKPLRNHYHRRN